MGRFISRAGLEDLTFHDLRHVATSRLARRFPNPLDLKRVTGHRDLKSLDRYYQPNLTELAKAGETQTTRTEQIDLDETMDSQAHLGRRTKLSDQPVPDA